MICAEFDGAERGLAPIDAIAPAAVAVHQPYWVRAGRFDFVLELSLPDAAARLEIFKVHTRGKPRAPDVELAELAGTASEGRSICSRRRKHDFDRSQRLR